MSGALKKTKKRKQKQKPTREDDIPPDLKLDIFQFVFIFDPYFSGTSYLLLLCTSQKKMEMRRRKRRRRKRLKSLRRSRWRWLCLKGKGAFIFLLPATPVHRAGSDDSVELFQDWLSRGHNQQNPTEWIGHPTLPKVETKITVDRFQLVFV